MKRKLIKTKNTKREEKIVKELLSKIGLPKDYVWSKICNTKNLLK